MPTLAQARRNKSLTQRQLADQLGVTPTLISAWERGTRKPDLRSLEKLCEVLGVKLEEIQFLPKPEQPNSEKPVAPKEQSRQQTEDYNERMGYVDASWLRGGRYDIDPAFHETP